MEDTKKQNLLKQELVKLAEIQQQISMVDACQFQKNNDNMIKNELLKLRTFVTSQAKLYGRNDKQVEEIISKFEQEYLKVQLVYQEKRNQLVKEKSDLETADIKLMAEYNSMKKENQQDPEYKKNYKKFNDRIEKRIKKTVEIFLFLLRI